MLIVVAIKQLYTLKAFYNLVWLEGLHLTIWLCNVAALFNMKKWLLLYLFLSLQCHIITFYFLFLAIILLSVLTNVNKCILWYTEKENLCLYGFPSEQWEVNLPAEEVPPELPEPALGINFARDGMQEKDWLSLVAVHSEARLLSVAFYFGARFGFDRADRYLIFIMNC